MNEQFWILPSSEQIAFILPDGRTRTYAQLTQDVAAFQDRLGGRKGLLGLRCSGQYAQYVAYLGALQAQCPVLLMPPNQSTDKTGLSLTHIYDPETDHLESRTETGPELHPQLAVLLSTSGSTGAAKWVRLSYDNIAANAGSIATYLGLSDQDRAPMALPFQYSYGMSVVNSHLAVGGGLALIEGSVLDQSFWARFDDSKCTGFAGVPHSFELMEQGNIQTHHLQSLRYVTQAGGKLAPSRVRDWAARGQEEGWSFFVMYGQTEAAPRISYLPPDRAIEAPEAIGIPVPGGALWVADETGTPVPEGTQGELVYRGPNTMMGYATKDADLAKPQGSDILQTGDIAVEKDGLFQIVGRSSRFVKVFGYRINLDEVEKHLAEQNISAACGAAGEQMVVFLTKDGPPPESVTRDIAKWLSIPPDAFRVDTLDHLPRRENGKVDYPALSALITQLPDQKADADAPRKGLARLFGASPKTVGEIFAHRFPDEEISSEVSFNDLGGDSLSYLVVAQDLERLLGDLPEDWPTRPLADLEAITPKTGWIGWMDTATVIRALAIIMVVVGHFGLYDYGGTAVYALYFIAGMTFSALTLPAVLQTHSLRPVLILLARILVLTWLAMTVIWGVTGYGAPLAYAMITNWIDPSYPGGVWFIAVYVQTLLGLMALLAFALAHEGLRQRLQSDPFLPIAALTAVLVALVPLTKTPYATDVLFLRLPHLMAWIFVCGALAYVADTALKKAITLGLFLAGWGLLLGTLKVVLVLVPALILLPALPVPRLLSPAIRQIAGASLMIYLSHFPFRDVLLRVVDAGPFGAVVFAIAGGVVAWACYRPLDDRLRMVLSRRPKEPRNA